MLQVARGSDLRVFGKQTGLNGSAVTFLALCKLVPGYVVRSEHIMCSHSQILLVEHAVTGLAMAAFRIRYGMVLLQTRVLAWPRRARRINRGPSSPTSLSHTLDFLPPTRLRSVPCLISFPLPPGPVIPQLASQYCPRSGARVYIVLAVFCVPRLPAVARLTKRYWVRSSFTRALGRDVTAFTVRFFHCNFWFDSSCLDSSSLTLARPSSPFGAAQYPLGFPPEQRLTSSIPQRPAC